jgi:hypothetical protein
MAGTFLFLGYQEVLLLSDRFSTCSSTISGMFQVRKFEVLVLISDPDCSYKFLFHGSWVIPMCFYSVSSIFKFPENFLYYFYSCDHTRFLECICNNPVPFRMLFGAVVTELSQFLFWVMQFYSLFGYYPLRRYCPDVIPLGFYHTVPRWLTLHSSCCILPSVTDVPDLF